MAFVVHPLGVGTSVLFGTFETVSPASHVPAQFEGGLVAPHEEPLFSKSVSPAFLSNLVRNAHAAESRAYLSSSPLGENISAVERELRVSCACDSFRVKWSLTEQLQTELDALRDIENVSWNRVSPGTRNERVAVSVHGLRDGRPRVVWIQGTPECLVGAYRTLRGLSRGSVIADEDREFATGWMSPEEARGALELTEDPTGLYVTQPLGRNDWIGATSVKDAPAVRRGETLQIVVRSAGFEVRCTGSARRDAWVGDRIRVRVDGAARDCEGAVIASGLVEVGVPRRGAGS